MKNKMKKLLILIGAVALAGLMTGCTSPLLSQDPVVRKQAVEAINDDKQLFLIAMNVGVDIGRTEGCYTRIYLTEEHYPDDVRGAAVERLKNMDYLLMCASWNDGDIYVDPGYAHAEFEYCGKKYYCSHSHATRLREVVAPGNVVRTAAINRLSDFATFKEAVKSLDGNAKENKLLPKTPKEMSRWRTENYNDFIYYYGRRGNPLDKALRTALEKLKQPDAAAEFLYNAAEGGQGIAPETFGYAMEHLEGVSSKVASSIFRKIFKEHHNNYTKNEWMPILIRYIDDLELETAIVALKIGGKDEKTAAAVVSKIKSQEAAEKLLAARDDSGSFLLTKVDHRIALMKMLPENKMVNLALSSIKRHDVYKWNEGKVGSLVLGINVMSCIKDTKAVVKIASAILAKIAEYRKACKDSWTMNWDSSDENKVKNIMGRLPKLSDDALAELICLDDISWKYFMGTVTENVAYKVLTLGKAKSDKLEEELVKKLPADKVDMNVYNGVKTDAGKKAVLAAMPTELKKSAQESAEKAFASVLEKAKVAAKETFELHGFYLGMDFDDMKQVLSHHFPDYTIVERRDGDGKDADYVAYVPTQSTPFCYASANDKKVYQFNFGKKMLKKWYKYDVQTYMEWAHAYEREMKINMKFKIIDKDATVYEPMDMSRSYKVWFHQESYQYKHNTKGYRLTYFGEEKDFTIEGGIGGAIIKEIAAPRFRYVRGDPGSLRATVEND